MEEKIKQTHPTVHKYLFTVTTFSKLLALSLFIILPFLGFYLGMKYQEAVGLSGGTQEIINYPKSSKINLPSTPSMTPAINKYNQPTPIPPQRYITPTVDVNLSNQIIKDISSTVNPDKNPIVKMQVLKIVGNFAWVDVSIIGGPGYALLAMNKDNQWVKIWSGQANFPCLIANTYNVPKDLYGTCY
jgi:hypothetical protein